MQGWAGRLQRAPAAGACPRQLAPCWNQEPARPVCTSACAPRRISATPQAAAVSWCNPHPGACLWHAQAEAGGEFEYCPNIRCAEDERFDAVRDVLDGSVGGERLPLRPGDLQLFKGRYSLHRVSPVEGAVARHSAIFAYSERPGVIGSVARTRQLFGRVLPEHLAAEGRAVRSDRLLD